MGLVEIKYSIREEQKNKGQAPLKSKMVKIFNEVLRNGTLLKVFYGK